MNERAAIAGSHVAQALAQVSRLPGGESVTIRPVRREDADALRAYFRGLSGETRYRRVLGAMAELTGKQLARLTEMEGPDALALVAFAEIGGTSCLVGEAVLVTVPGSSRSEMALSVADDWQRKGGG